MNVLVWLHRDLRLHDHPALSAAAEVGAVLPLFVADPAVWAAPEASARQWDFLAETLVFQRQRFAEAGAPLAVRVGDSAEVLARLCRRHHITRVVSSDEPGPQLRAAAGVEWLVHGSGQAEPPALRAIEGVEPGPIPPARALRLAPDRCPNRQIGVDPARLLSAAMAPHKAGRSIATMERGASRLSPYLAWGCVSPTDMAANGRLRRAMLRRAEAMDNATPMVPTGEALHPAWAQGQTGLPFTDACLRYLAAGGWLPAPLRAMVVSAAVHHLGACPVRVAQMLARLSTDHHPKLLAYGMSQALRRPVDPVAMGRRLDPDGSFTRRWVPELAPVPDDMVQTPWRWQGARHLLGRRYPEPLVDPAAALRGAAPLATIKRATTHRRSSVAPGQLVLAF